MYPEGYRGFKSLSLRNKVKEERDLNRSPLCNEVDIVFKKRYFIVDDAG